MLNDFKIKMAVDVRRKWLPREKVMPGKPGREDGDVHASSTNETAVRSSVPPSEGDRNTPAPHGRQKGMTGTVAQPTWTMETSFFFFIKVAAIHFRNWQKEKSINNICWYCDAAF